MDNLFTSFKIQITVGPCILLDFEKGLWKKYRSLVVLVFVKYLCYNNKTTIYFKNALYYVGISIDYKC